MSVLMALAHLLALGHCSSIGTSCSFIWSSVMSWCCWLQDQLHSQNCILVSFFSHAGFSPWLLHVPHHDETTLSDLASLVPFCLHFLFFYLCSSLSPMPLPVPGWILSPRKTVPPGYDAHVEFSFWILNWLAPPILCILSALTTCLIREVL